VVYIVLCLAHYLFIVNLLCLGRGRFAEVWKGSLHQEDNTNQVVSVKVFQLRNYGAWRQEKEMLTER